MKTRHVIGALVLGAAMALACKGDSDGKFTVAISGEGAPERGAYTVCRGDDCRTDTVAIPDSKVYYDDNVRVIISVPEGVVGCVITNRDGDVVGIDVNPDRRVADCAVSV